MNRIELTPEDIEHISQMRSDGQTWETIATEYDCTDAGLRGALEREGFMPRDIGNHGMPTITPQGLYGTLSSIKQAHVIRRSGRCSYVVMPLSDYLKLKGSKARRGKADRNAAE